LALSSQERLPQLPEAGIWIIPALETLPATVTGPIEDVLPELRGEVIESAKRIHRKPDRHAKRAVASRQFNQIGDGMRDFFWIQRRRGEPLKKFLDISLAGS
jgi:hypothetical protein